LMGFWLQRRGVWQVIARAGRYDLAAIGLAMAGVGVNWMLSEMIYSSAAAITGNPDLPVNRPGYEWELTAENVWSDVFSAGIAAPLFEETAFRGLMLGVLLARGWQTWPAVLVTAAAFALTHGQYYFVGVLDIFAAGIVFGALRIYSGGLFAPMLCHSAMNLSITFTEWNALQDEPLALMRLLS